MAAKYAETGKRSHRVGKGKSRRSGGTQCLVQNSIFTPVLQMR